MRIPSLGSNWFRTAAFLGLSIGASVAVAGDVKYEPYFRVGAEYNDNLRLNTNDDQAIDVGGLEAEARLRVTNQSQTGLLRIEPAVVATRYPDSEGDNFEDYYLTLYGRTTRQRSSWELGARYWREAVLDAELSDADFDNPDIPAPISADSGLVGIEDTRELFGISPGAEFTVSERMKIGVSANLNNVDYSRSETSGLVGFDDLDAGVSLVRALDEQSDLSVRVFGSKFDADEINNEADGYGVTVRYEHRFSPRMQVYAQGGYLSNDVDFVLQGVAQNQDANTGVFSLGLIRTAELTRILADVSRSVDPTGGGFLVERTQLRLRYARQFSPYLTGAALARLQQTESLVGDNPNVERDFAQAGVELTWRLNRHWSVEGGVTHTRQDVEVTPGDATANEIRIGVIYEPRRRN